MLLRPDGTVVAEAETRYATGTVSPPGSPGAMEQDPEEWLTAFGAAVGDVMRDVPTEAAPAAVALSGQMQDVCLVARGRSIRRSLLYSDVRAVDEAEHILACLGPERGGGVRGLSNFKGAAACLSKWLWLKRREPDVLAATEHILLGAHSYLAYVLTGGEAVVCDPTTASTTGLLAPPTRTAAGEVEAPRWAEDAVRSLNENLDPSLLPSLLRGATPGPVGTVSRVTLESRLRHLPSVLVGTPVFHGVGDLASTTVGAVGLGPGAAYAYLGTSGWIATCVPWSKATKREVGAPGVFRLLHPDADVAIVAASMVTAGGNAEWARGVLLPDGGNGLEDLDAAAGVAPPGCDGVLYLPHLNGERSPFTDPTARGSFVNLSPRTTRGHLCRAVLEGVAYNYRALAESLNAELDATDDEKEKGAGVALPPPLPLVGGGARSRLWTQTLADVLGRPVKPVPDAATVAARGTAAGAFRHLGLWGERDDQGDDEPPAPAGYFPTSLSNERESDGADGADNGMVFPDPATRATHDANYAVFVKLHDALVSSGVADLAT